MARGRAQGAKKYDLSPGWFDVRSRLSASPAASRRAPPGASGPPRIDRQFGEGAALWAAPELAEPVGAVEVERRQDVEQVFPRAEDSILLGSHLRSPTGWRSAHLDSSILRQNSRSPRRWAGAGNVSVHAIRYARIFRHLQEDRDVELP